MGGSSSILESMNEIPCAWPAEYQGGECACKSLADLPANERASWEAIASQSLWAWTGRRYGLCETTVRPCRSECEQIGSTFTGGRATLQAGTGWVPVIIDGAWWNISCGRCGVQKCSCRPDDSVALALPGVVASIDSIWIDGEQLPPTAYTLRDGVLYRTDGGIWPECNDEIADPRAANSTAWEITYQRGIPVPEGGGIMVGLLACELAKAACGDSSCQLPKRVQSVSRQGVTVGAVLDSFDDIKDGRTGIWIIDNWVATLNAPRTAPPKIYSPDIEPGRGRGTFRGMGRGRTW